MSAPFLATVTILSGAQPKGGGGNTHLAVITPLSGERPSHGLPEAPGAIDPGWGVTPPTDPGYGHPGLPGWSGGHPGAGFPIAPGHPSGGFPIDPARPDNSLPPGGTPVPPEVSNGLPPPAGDYGNQVVVAVYVPGKGWTAKAYVPATPTPVG